MRTQLAAVAQRGAGLLPAPLLDRARLAEAARLETRLRRSSAVRGAALVFHSVAPRQGDHRTQLDPPLAAERLDAAVSWLVDRYELVRACELPAAARARRPGQRVPVALTFDDDLTSHLEHAAAIIRRHGGVATAFLCGAREPLWWQLLQVAVDTGAIAASDLPHVGADVTAPALEQRPGAIGRLAKAIEDLGPAQRAQTAAVLRAVAGAPAPPLGPAGVAALAAAGWEIGAHTARHDLVTALDDEALHEALAAGRQIAGCEEPARTLAYPHGKAHAREARAAQRAGYVAAYTGRPEPLTERTDDHLIGRLQPDSSSPGRFALGLARALGAS